MRLDGVNIGTITMMQAPDPEQSARERDKSIAGSLPSSYVQSSRTKTRSGSEIPHHTQAPIVACRSMTLMLTWLVLLGGSQPPPMIASLLASSWKTASERE